MPFGDYNTWCTQDGGNNDKSSEDKLNQSSTSRAMDDMVSRIVEDDTQTSNVYGGR